MRCQIGDSDTEKRLRQAGRAEVPIFAVLLTLGFLSIGFLTLGIGGVLSAQESRLNRPVFPSVDEVLECFSRGQMDGYGTGEILFWNDRTDAESIRTVFDELASQGVKETFFYPTFGLVSEYLSEEFFQEFEQALAEAKRHGMKLWLYDEYSWPSGFAGGKLIDAIPTAAASSLAFSDIAVDSNTTLPENTIAVYRRLEDRWQNITQEVKDRKITEPNARLVVRGRAGREERLAGGAYCDMLQEGVTEKFIELTHKGYLKHSGGEFGKTIPGVFTDEMTLRRAGPFPWTDDLPSWFEKKYGYSLLDVLPLLQTGGSTILPEGRRVTSTEARHHYLATLLDLVHQRWAKPIFDFCEEHGIVSTGHYEEHLWSSVLSNIDAGSIYMWQQQPAIDLIFNQWSDAQNGQAGNVRIVRELGSAASQTNRQRTSVEMAGAAGWAILPSDLKRLSDWLFVLGVTHPMEMGPQLSVRGSKKFDEGPSLFYHMPYWPDYHLLLEYDQRVSYLLSQGRRPVDTLILQPTTTFWKNMHHGELCGKIASSFCDLLKECEAAQIEYELGNETIMAKLGSAEQAGVLSIGPAQYRRVVLPEYFDNIETSTLALLAQFVENGGSVILLGKAPYFVSGTPAAESDAAEQFSRFFDAEKIQSLPSDLTFPVSLSGGVYSASREQFLAADWNRSTRFFSTDDSAEANFSIPYLYHLRKKTKDGEILFFVNTNRDGDRSFRCRIFPDSAENTWSEVVRCDLFTGKVIPYPIKPVNEGGRAGVELAVTLPPIGSLALVLREGPEPAAELSQPAPSQPAITRKVIEPDTVPEIERLDNNVMVLNYGTLHLGGEVAAENQYYSALDKKMWEHFGYKHNPWYHIPQHKHDLIDRRFDAESGYETRWKFTIDESYFAAGGAKPFYAVVEEPNLMTIVCNGQKVSPSDDWWFDRSGKKIDLSSAIKAGENEITLSLKPMNIFCEIVPIYLLGDFDLAGTPNGFTITASSKKTWQNNPESLYWSNLGMPFYGERVAYKETFTIDKKESCRYFVQMPKLGYLGYEPGIDWNAATAHIQVNGEDAGVIYCEPCRVDVTGLTRDGINTVEVILTGTPRNWCGPHFKGKYYIERGYYNDFDPFPDQPPAWDAYDLIPYGLTRPFTYVEEHEQ